jgi:hypothetical protein
VCSAGFHEDAICESFKCSSSEGSPSRSCRRPSWLGRTPRGLLAGFLSKRLGTDVAVSPKNQLQGIVVDDFVAKKAGHFLEDRAYKQNLTGIISDDNTLIQCFENGLHLLEPLRSLAVHEISHAKYAMSGIFELDLYLAHDGADIISFDTDGLPGCRKL